MLRRRKRADSEKLRRKLAVKGTDIVKRILPEPIVVFPEVRRPPFVTREGHSSFFHDARSCRMPFISLTILLMLPLSLSISLPQGGSS